MTPKKAEVTPTEPSDGALWAAAQAGSEAAFERFYNRHRPLAMRIAAGICGTEAEDAVQAAFMSAWRSRDSFSPGRGNARSWLMSVVRNRAVDVVRAKGRRREHLAYEGHVEVEDPVRTEDVAVGRETARQLRAAIEELPARQRQVLELGYFAELSQSEIADTLRVPLGTVKGRTRLALQRLAAFAA